MQTVDKAFELLGLFSERRPQFGLSELARLAGFDKATTRRLLLALSKHGLVEQDPRDKRYRLGPGVLRLARVREATAPLASVAAPLLQRLAECSGETAHLTVLAGALISTVAVEESHRSNRVTMEIGEVLPLHATASGLVALAFAADAVVNALEPGGLQAYTENTRTSARELRTMIHSARQQGFVVNEGWYEPDVCSVAAPFFDQHRKALGAVAVAAPSTRFSNEEQATIRTLVLNAAAELTTRIGGSPPADKVA